MKEEYFDILNNKGEPTGESCPASEVHQKGLIHRTVHIWFLNSKGELLIQKRSAKSSYSNFWDISAAGHVSAGQKSLEAAIRETQEELGVSLNESELKYLFTTEHHAVLNNGTYFNNEFSDVYLVHRDILVDEFRLDSKEVSEVRWMSVQEFRRWVDGRGEKIVPHAEEYSRLLAYIETDILPT